MKVNYPALDKKLRRKASRKQRQDGLSSLNLDKLQRKAVRDTGLRCALSEQAAHGTALERQAARKAKRKLNDVWTNRNQHSLKGFWDSNAN